MTETRRSAVISPCGLYRLRLERTWDDSITPLGFVMLNASTADAEVDDPTIRRCVGFARREGAGGLVVGNLFGWRSPDPEAMKRARDPCGELNIPHLLQIARDCGNRLVCAWGVHGVHLRQDERVKAVLRSSGVTLLCLGKTKAGHPKHPLYLSANSLLVPL